MKNKNQQSTQKQEDGQLSGMIQEIEKLKGKYLEKKKIMCVPVLSKKASPSFNDKQKKLEEEVRKIAEENKNKPEYKYLKVYVKNRQMLAEQVDNFERDIVSIIVAIAGVLIAASALPDKLTTIGTKIDNVLIVMSTFIIIASLIAVIVAIVLLIKKMIQRTEAQFYGSCLNILELE